jgi:hypothetical protein
MVDADSESVIHVQSEEDLISASKSEAANTKVVTFDDNEDVEMKKERNVKRSIIEDNETMIAPSQLSQYQMTVTCKWRLAALISFLKAHQREKLIVFFSTCDSGIFRIESKHLI